MAGPLRGRGGGVKGRGIKEKKTFFGTFFQRSNGHYVRGGWGFGLNGPAIKRRTFFAASISIKELKWTTPATTRRQKTYILSEHVR